MGNDVGYGIKAYGRKKGTPEFLNRVKAIKEAIAAAKTRITELDEQVSKQELQRRENERILNKLQDLKEQNPDAMVQEHQRDLDTTNEQLRTIRREIEGDTAAIQTAVASVGPLLAQLYTLRHSLLVQVPEQEFYTNFCTRFDDARSALESAAGVANVTPDVGASEPGGDHTEGPLDLEQVVEIMGGANRLLALLNSDAVTTIEVIGGKTGRGKSTLGKAVFYPDGLVKDEDVLQNMGTIGEELMVQLVRQLRRQGWVTVPLEQDPFVVGDGNGGLSTTLIPNVHVDSATGTAYVDLPGWDDNHGPVHRLAVDAIHRAIFKTGKVSALKVVVAWDDLTARDGVQAKSIFKTIQATGLAGATQMVVTFLPQIRARFDTYGEYAAEMAQFLTERIPQADGLTPDHRAASAYFAGLVGDAIFADYADYDADVRTAFLTTGPSLSTPLAAEDVTFVLSAESLDFLERLMMAPIDRLADVKTGMERAERALLEHRAQIPDLEALVARIEGRRDEARALLSRDLDGEIETMSARELAFTVALKKLARKLRDAERARDRAEEKLAAANAEENPEILLQEGVIDGKGNREFKYDGGKGPVKRYEAFQVDFRRLNLVGVYHPFPVVKPIPKASFDALHSITGLPQKLHIKPK